MPANQIDIKVTADTSDAEKGLNDVGASAASMGDKMGATGRRMSLGVTLPLVAAGGAAFKMASDLGEATSQAEQVFGDGAAGIIDAAQNMNDSFSEEEYLSFASTFGDIAQGLGFAKNEADDLSIGVLDLAQDLGSFKNLPTEQAVDAITAAMAGEREQLKSLGIVINEQMVKERALADRADGVTGALTMQEKAAASLALITEKSANAVGDFDRTSQGAANKTRILTANFKDTAATLGENLIPIGTQLLEWTNGMISAFGSLSPTMQKVVVTVAAIAAAIGPALMIGGKMIKMFQTLKIAMAFLAANPYLVLIAATVALVVLIVQNWDTIKEKIGAVWGWIKDTTGAVWDWIRDKVSSIASFLTDLFLNWTLPGRIIQHWDTIKGAATATKDFVIDKFRAMVDWFKLLPGRIGNAFVTLAGAIKAPFVSAFNAIRSLWNSTAGGFGFTIPGWIPGVGGRGFHIPEMHTGGLFDSGRGEGLARLQDGEFVLTRQQTASLRGAQPSAGAAGQMVTVPVQVVMPDGRVLAEVVAQANLESGGQFS